MEKFFSFQDKKGGSSLPVTSSLRDGSGIPCGKRIGTSSSGWGYNIRDKDLKKIHKVAIMGNVRKLQKVLIFGKHGVNERDKMNRTALHLACASGHPDVVALLVERKCQLNFFDGDYRTALMKAVQCQNERCVSILLEHGADPNLVDVAGNNSLHYAAIGSNTLVAEKLLHHANIEARSKDVTRMRMKEALGSRKSTEVNFACILAVSNTASLLEQEILEEIGKLDDVVQDLYVTEENGTQIR